MVNIARLTSLRAALVGGSFIAAAALALVAVTGPGGANDVDVQGSSVGIDVADVATLQQRLPEALRRAVRQPKAAAADHWAQLPDTLDGRVRLGIPGGGAGSGHAGWRMLDVPALPRVEFAGGAGYVGDQWDVVQFAEDQKLREYIVVHERQGKRTWRWQLYAATRSHRITVLDDGRVDLGNGFHLDPPQLLDPRLQRLKQDVAWKLQGDVLELTFDDAELQLPYVIDPDTTPPTFTFQGWTTDAFSHYNAADDPNRLWFNGTKSGTATARVRAIDSLEPGSGVQHVSWGAPPSGWTPAGSDDSTDTGGGIYLRAFGYTPGDAAGSMNVTATDLTGNVSAPLTLQLEEDSTQPVVDPAHEYDFWSLSGWNNNSNANTINLPPASAFSDAGSSAPGVGTLTRELQRRDGVPDGWGGCNTWLGSWTVTATNPAGTSIVNGPAAVAGPGLCSEFRYVIRDAVGNELTLYAGGYIGNDNVNPDVAVTSIDENTNPEFQHVIGANRIYFNPDESGSFTVNAQPFDAHSGPFTVRFQDPTAQTGWSNTVTPPFEHYDPGPYAQTFEWQGPAAASLAGETLTVTDYSGRSAALGNRYYIDADATAPTGGAITYGPLGWRSDATVQLNVTPYALGTQSLLRTQRIERDQAQHLPGDATSDCSGSVWESTWSHVVGTWDYDSDGLPPSIVSDTTIQHGYCYRYRLVAEDNVGNVATDWHGASPGGVIAIDHVAPIVTFDLPDGSVISGSASALGKTDITAIRGTAQDGSAGPDSLIAANNVRIRWENLGDSSSGQFTTATPDPVTNEWSRAINTTTTATPDGSYLLHVEVTDRAGNVTTITRNVTIDNAVPTITFSHFSQGTNPQYSFIDPVAANTRIWVKTNGGASGSLFVNTLADMPSVGIDRVEYFGGPTNYTPAGQTTWFAGTSTPPTWQMEYAWTDGASAFTTHNSHARAISNSGRISTSLPFTIQQDHNSPSGGSLTYPTGWQIGSSLTLAVTHYIDTQSGVREARIERDQAPRTMPDCASSAWEGTWSTVIDSWSTAVDGPEGTWPTSVIDATVQHGMCYRYRLVAVDNVSNTATDYNGASPGSAVAIDQLTPNVTFDLAPGTVLSGRNSAAGNTAAASITGIADDGIAGPNSMIPNGAIEVRWVNTGDASFGSFGTASANTSTLTWGRWIDTTTSATPDGSYELYVDYRDNAGNTATAGPVPVMIDNSPPDIELASFDLGTPACQHWSGLPSTTIYFNTGMGDPNFGSCAAGEFTVNATANDFPGGIAYVEFPHTDPIANSVTPDAADGQDPTAPYAMRYAYSATAGSPGAERMYAWGNSGQRSSATLGGLTFQRDTTDPTGFAFPALPAVGHPGGTTNADFWSNDPSPLIGFTVGTDATSGMKEYRLERQEEPRSGTACPVIGSWTGPWLPVAGSANATLPFEDAALAQDMCYRYRIIAEDNVSNYMTGTSGRHVRIDTTLPTGSFDPVPVVVKGMITLQGSADDNWSGIAAASSIAIEVDGVPGSGCASANSYNTTTDVWTCSWDTTTAPDGPATVRLVVRDRAGNVLDTLTHDTTIDNTAPTGTVTLAEVTGDQHTHVVAGAPERIYVNTNAGMSGTFTATLTPDDGAGTGVTSATFPPIGSGWTPLAATPLGAPFAQTYGWTGGASTAAPAAPGTHTILFQDAAANPGTAAFEVVADPDAPTGVSIDYADGPASSALLTISAGSDAGSGLASWRLERRETSVTGPGTCDTSWSAWTDLVTETTGTAPASYTDGTLVLNSCYQYRVVVTDQVGNAVTAADAEDDTVTVEPVGVVITETGAATEVVEGGATDTYTVRLRTRPTSNVMIAVTGDAEASAAPNPLTFTTANWNVDQTVTVTAVQDDVEEALVPHTGTITHTVTSSDTDYHAIPVGDVAATITDDDTHGITLSPAHTSLSVDEADVLTGDTYTIVLDSQPTANVTISLASLNSEITFDAPAVTFTPGAWNVPQIVTVYPADDDVTEPTPHLDEIIHSVSSSDPMYADETPPNALVEIDDDDVAGIVLTPASGLTLAENAADGDTSVTFAVQLQSEPTDDVLVNVTGDADADATPGLLAFTPMTWDTPQTVTVDVVDDLIAEGPHTATISFTVTSTSDGNYNGIAAAPHMIDVIDDDVPGIEVSPLSGLTATEGGAGTSYQIRLLSQPAGDVEISFLVDAELQPIGTISFTPTDYGWRTVTVNAFDDDIDELLDPHVGTITHVITSATDTVYPSLTIADQSVSITDDDTAGITVDDAGGIVVDEAASLTTDTFTLQLDSQPSQPVTLTAVADAPAQVALTDATVTFDDTNWFLPHTVTVAAIDDAVDETSPHDGDITIQVSTADSRYLGVSDPTLTADVLDNDDSTITIEPGTLALDETGEPVQSYDISIGSQPQSDLVIAVNPDAQLETDVSSITFTAADWAPRTIQVNAIDDLVVESNPHAGVVGHAVTSGDAGYLALGTVDDKLADISDNDTPGVTVNPLDGVDVHEDGSVANDTYEVVLDRAPQQDVQVQVVADAQVSVDSTELTFTSGNWNVPQIVTVTAVDDDVQEAPIHPGTITHTVSSTDPLWTTITTAAQVDVDVHDDDIAAVIVTQTGPYDLSEDTPTDTVTYTVELDTQPTAPVTVDLVMPVQGDLAADTTSLTFTDAHDPQTVTVNALDDSVYELPTPVHTRTIAHTVTSADAFYQSIPVDDVAFNITDNDIPGITVSETSLDVSEGGGSATFEVRLGTEPTDTVRVAFTNSQVQTDVPYVEFAPGSWAAQTITVTALDDAIDESSPHAGLIELDVTSATDTTYDAWPLADISVNVTDNDDAGITITPGTTPIQVTEAGAGSATYDIQLTSEPTSPVTILIGGEAGQVSLDQASITIDPADWQTPVQVTVTANDDQVDEPDPHQVTLTHAASSTDLAYTGLTIDPQLVDVIDDDTASIDVAPTTLTLDEADIATTASFTVTLGSEPTSPVTVTVATPDGQSTTDRDELVFTAANWDTGETVVVTVVDDDIAEGSPHTGHIELTATSSPGDEYESIDPDDVQLDIADDDVAGVLVTESAGSTDVDEAGATDSYTLRLTSRPLAPVTIRIDNVGGQAGTTPDEITIAPDDWDTDVTITVTGTPDFLIEGAHTQLLAHAITAGDATYMDPSLTVADVTVNISDDDAAGVTITPTTLDVTEGESTDATYTVVLTAQPTADVTVTLGVDPQLSSDAPSLLFTSANWDEPQTVTVNAADDFVVEGEHTAAITHATVSTDTDFDAIAAVSDVVVTITDDDIAGVTISTASLDVTEGGATVTYDVSLTSYPSAPVEISFAEVGGQLQPIAPITIQPADWDQPHTVTVETVDDFIAEGLHVAQITHDTASTDANYAMGTLTIAPVDVNITDNDIASVLLTPPSGLTGAEGSTISYDVSLTSQPTGPVQLTLTGDADGIPAPLTLDFDASNWMVAQPVAVTLVQDFIDEGAHTTTITGTLTTAPAEYAAVMVADQTISITDDDTAGVVFTPAVPGPILIAEGGTAETYTVALTSEPTDPVTIDLTSIGGQATLTPATITIQPADWATTHSISVEAIDDDVTETTPHLDAIAHVTGSDDTNYGAMTLPDMNLEITDNDVPGIVLAANDADTTVTEGGATDTVRVSLATKPLTNVQVTLTGTQVTLNPAVIDFAPDDWNTPVDVEVTAVDDAIAEGVHAGQIDALAGGEPLYLTAPPVSHPVAINDNDVAGVAITQPADPTLSEDTPTAGQTYQVKLTSEPTADVIVRLLPDAQVLTDAPLNELTFTPLDWNVEQTVTVTAVDDTSIEVPDPHVGIISHDTDSTDAMYGAGALTIDDVAFNITDNDIPEVLISDAGPFDLDEDQTLTETYNVSLKTMPSAAVTITPDSTQLEWTVPSITLDASNWSAGIDVTIRAIDDNFDESGPHPGTMALTLASADANYDALPAPDVTAQIVDNDISELIYTPDAGLQVTENDELATVDYVITLATEPIEPVNIAIMFDAAQVTVTPTTAMLDSSNWNTGVNVTVSAVDDAIDETDPHEAIIAHEITSDDPTYSALAAGDYQLIDIEDNDTAGVTIEHTGGSTDVAEDGTVTDSYTVRLDTQPVADVMINVANADGQVESGSGTLTFTPADWNAAQTVSITAIDDAVIEAPVHPGEVEFTATSTDPNYELAAGSIPNLTANVTDDDVAGIVATPDGALEIAEGGTTDTITYTLTSIPSAPVTIDLATADGETTVTPAQVILDATNWDTGVQVIVEAVDDGFIEGAHSGQITYAVASPDLNYDALPMTADTVQITDNDAADIIVDVADGVALDEADGAATDTFTVKLGASPAVGESVTVDLQHADGQLTFTPATLTFTDADYGDEQTVTVTVVDDAIDEADPHTGTISFDVTSGDTDFDAFAVASIDAAIADDDDSGIELSATTADVAEAGATSETITVQLTSEPLGDVEVSVTGDAQATATTTPDPLVFTAANWNTPQDITITAIDDPVDEADPHPSVTTVSVSSVGGSDAAYDAVADSTIDVSVADDDTAAITVTPRVGNPAAVEEADPLVRQTYDVVLTSQPTDDVVITVLPDAQIGAVATTLTFTSSDWNVAQPVEVLAINDDVAEAPTHPGELAFGVASDDGTYASLLVPVQSVDVLDDDAAGVTVAQAPTPQLLDEAGTLPTATYTVQLTSQPLEDVTVALAPDAQVEIAGGATELTITPADWNVPHDVEVSAVDDLISEATPHPGIIAHDTDSLDPAYAAGVLTLADAAFAIDDDDVAGFTLDPTTPAPSVDEEGATSATYTLAIDSVPATDVTVNFAHADGQVTVTPASHTFSATAMDPVTITVTAVDDAVVEDPTHDALITHELDAASDPVYLALPAPAIADVTAQVTDNDAAGVLVDEGDGVSVAEDGETSDTFTVTLESEPTADVTVSFDGGSQLQDMTGQTVTFTAANWSDPQTVTVTAADDAVTETSPHDAPIAITVASADLNYDTLGVADVVATVDDDDVPQLEVVAPTTLDMAEVDAAGTEQRIGFRLLTQPAGDVTINAVADDQLVMFNWASITFTPTNWNDLQEFTFQPFDDQLAEAEFHDGIVSFSITAPDDPGYAALPVDPVTFNIEDDDFSSATIECRTGPNWSWNADGKIEVAEDPAASNHTVGCYVGIGVAVADDVTVEIATSDPAQLTADITSFTIPAGTTTAQLITFTAVNDAIAEGIPHDATIEFTVDTASPVYGAMTIPTVDVAILDDDVASLVVTPNGPVTVTEGGAGSSIEISLATQPLNDVTVTIAGDSQVSANQTTLTFTPANWNTTQLVGVRAIDDDMDEPDGHLGQLTLTVASPDAAYDAVSPVTVDAQVTDNDQAMVVVESTGDGDRVVEGGATDELQVRLATIPTSDVTVSLTTDAQLSAAPATLTFTPVNWSTPQTVTITAAQDTAVEGDHTGNLTFTLASNDIAYGPASAATPGVRAINITDDDKAGIKLVESDGTTVLAEGGATDTYTITLTGQPTADVVISPNGGAQVVLEPASLTFTPASWNEPQTVTVRAIQDAIDEADPHPGEVKHEVTTTAVGWTELNLASITAQITDDDTAGVVLTESAGTTIVREGAKQGDTISFRLASQPTKPVNIYATGDEQLKVATDPIVLTPTKWNEPVVLQVEAVDDDEPEDDHNGWITFKIESEDEAYAKQALSALTVAIKDNDTDEDVTLETGDDEEKAKSPRAKVPPVTTRPGRNNGDEPAASSRRSQLGSRRTDSGKQAAAPRIGGGDSAAKKQEDIEDIKTAARATDTIEERAKQQTEGPLGDLLRWLAGNWKLWLPLLGLAMVAAGTGIYMARKDPVKAAQRTSGGKATKKLDARKASTASADERRKLRGGRRRKKKDDEDDAPPPPRRRRY